MNKQLLDKSICMCQIADKTSLPDRVKKWKWQLFEVLKKPLTAKRKQELLELRKSNQFYSKMFYFTLDNEWDLKQMI